MKNMALGVFLLLLVSLGAHRAAGQPLVSDASLPDAPEATQPTPASDSSEGGRVEGSVVDVQGAVVPGARVTLIAPGIAGSRDVWTRDDGTFVFTAIPAGRYRLIISADGMETFTSVEFATTGGETIAAPVSALRMAASSSSVVVTASEEQVAEAQVNAQEKQRVLGVFPNFYVSYIWKAAPMSAKQKYKLAFRASIDPVNFLVTAGVAGAEQWNGTYAGYGAGVEGYAKRYGAALADTFTSHIIGSAILPSLLHQDPRYFYQGSGGVSSRAKHAIASALITRGDNGKTEPNYSHILGSLAAGAIANSYHPAANRGLGLTFATVGVAIGANMVGDLIREFVLRGLVPSVPVFANGKEAIIKVQGTPNRR